VRNRGYTLFEMTVVLAVLATLAGVIVPRFVALQTGQESRDFASALMRLGSDARLVAIQTGQPVQVTFDETQGTIVFSTLDPETLVASENRTIPVPPTIELTAFTAGGVFATPAEWMLDFYPDGSGLSGGIEVLDGAHVYHVRINGDDGSSRRADGELEETETNDWQAGELEQRI
jgi:prepilin-type N-terminal cleavage/methylation domain-containing protein